MPHEITDIRFLTEDAFVIRFTRDGMQFKAGQRLLAGLKGELDQRDYSIYSSEHDDFLEILLKEVESGNISVKLKHSGPGQALQVNGPFGTFFPEPDDIASKKFMFIATGTGISPFHSIIKTHPDIDYTLFHGIRTKAEAYDRNEYDLNRYFMCTSGETNDGRTGRVTTFIQSRETDPRALYYLCGNGKMIYDVSHILRERGVPSQNIFSEIYF